MKIVWSSIAHDDFRDVLEYIEERYSPSKAADTVILVEKILERIILYPYMFPAAEGNNIRKTVPHKYLNVFYKISRNRILVLRIWDSRRDPDGLRLQ